MVNLNVEKLNILLVEDSPGDARLIEIYLEEAFEGNCSIKNTDRLHDAINYAHKVRYTLVILDLTLPDSHGLETFQLFKINVPDVPIVVLTGGNDEEMGTRAVQMGAQDFLMKNQLESSILKRSLNYAIERHILNKELGERTRKLEHSERSLKEAQRIAQLGSWEWDIEHNLVSCSDELFTIYGIDPATFKGSLNEFLANAGPDDKERVRNAFKKAVRDGRSFTFHHKLLKGINNVRDIYGRADVAIDDDGKAIRIVGTCQDITERRKEQALQKLAAGITTSFNAVTVSDKDGNIEWINEGFTKLSGYGLEEFQHLLKNIGRKKNCYTQRLANIKQIIIEKKPLTYECKNIKKTGEEYWVITTLTPTFDAKGNLDKIIGIESDITDRKKIEEELRIAHKMAEENLLKAKKALRDLKKANQQVEETARAKEKFLANMSHEIRTPMNGILGLTNLLLKGDHLTAEQREYLTAIKNSGDTLLVVINDILDISKMEAGKMTFESIPFKITHVINSVVELLDLKAREKSVEIIKQIDAKVPHVLLGDPVRLNQIIMNLMSNAVKFTRKGEIYLNVTSSGETEDNLALKISVTDPGRGIPKNRLSTLFQDFTQVSAEISRKYGGTGLGLSITKKLVELQGGTIEVESKIAQGSTFTVTIPFKKCRDENQIRELMKEKKQEEQESTELKGIRVLVVEDNAVNQMLAEKLLLDWGCEVELAEHGKIAIQKLNEKMYDLILMDIKMPVMDGYEATRFIREKMPAPVCNIPILAATAHAATWEAEKCIKAGMDSYISKPFDIKELGEKLIRLSGKNKNILTPIPQEKKVTQSQKPKAAKTSKKYTDLAYLQTVSKGNKDFVKRMINTFIAQNTNDIEKIKESLKNRNWDTLSFTAHKMKPSFHFVGIVELKDTIIELEKHARERTELDSVPELVEKIDHIFKASLIELNAELEQLENV